MALYHHPFTSGTHQYHTFPGFAQSTPPEPITNPPLPPQKYASSAVVVYTVLITSVLNLVGNNINNLTKGMHKKKTRNKDEATKNYLNSKCFDVVCPISPSRKIGKVKLQGKAKMLPHISLPLFKSVQKLQYNIELLLVCSVEYK